MDILHGYDTATDLPDHFVDLVHRTVGSAGRLVTEDFIGAEYFANWVVKYGTVGCIAQAIAGERAKLSSGSFGCAIWKPLHITAAKPP